MVIVFLVDHLIFQIKIIKGLNQGHKAIWQMWRIIEILEIFWNIVILYHNSESMFYKSVYIVPTWVSNEWFLGEPLEKGAFQIT